MPPLILPTSEEGNVMKKPAVEGAWLQLRSKRIIQTTHEDLRGGGGGGEKIRRMGKETSPYPN